jgi:predicted alpha/beta superfamily hydrolase
MGADLSGCIFRLWMDLEAECDLDTFEALKDGLERVQGKMPPMHAGEVLFVVDAAGPLSSVAGDFNNWDPQANALEVLCDSEFKGTRVAVNPGHHEYKFVEGSAPNDVWHLDTNNPAFAYDDFAGNPDAKNSVINTPDSDQGHLEEWDPTWCADAWCYGTINYFPPGYGAPENADRKYPVLFMYDGQNIFDQPGCCFGNGGWEVHNALNALIASGDVEETIVIGIPHGGATRIEENFPLAEDGTLEDFMEGLVGTLIPEELVRARGDADRIYFAGSSLGGHLAFRLAFTYPETFAGVASLSGSFWVGENSNQKMADFVTLKGMVDVALYMDHGGTADDSVADNYGSNQETRNALLGLGYAEQAGPDCTPTANAFCYYLDEGAPHTEGEWRARSPIFLQALLGL